MRNSIESTDNSSYILDIDSSLNSYIEQYKKYYLITPKPTDDYLIELYIHSLYTGKLPHINTIEQLNHIPDILPEWFTPSTNIIPNMIDGKYKMVSGMHPYAFMQRNKDNIENICKIYPKTHIIPPMFTIYDDNVFIIYQNISNKPIEFTHECKEGYTYTAMNNYSTLVDTDSIIETYDSPKYGLITVCEHEHPVIK